MNHKFQCKIYSGQMIDLDRDRFSQAIHAQKDGEYEIILRPKINWDVAQMRKYFHGPVLTFVQEQFKGVGCMYSKDQIKENFKYDFGPREEVPVEKLAMRNTVGIAKSMAEYDFKTYTKFLNDINAWCIEAFQCELPTAEEVE